MKPRGLSAEDHLRLRCYAIENSPLHINNIGVLFYVKRLPGPLARHIHIREAFFSFFIEIGSPHARALLASRLARATADPAAQQFREETGGSPEALTVQQNCNPPRSITVFSSCGTSKRRRRPLDMIADDDNRDARQSTPLRQVLDRYLKDRINPRTLRYVTLLQRVSCKFLEMITCEHPNATQSFLTHAYSYDAAGRKTLVPDRDLHLAEAAVKHVLGLADGLIQGEEGAWIARASSPTSTSDALSSSGTTASKRHAEGFRASHPEHARAKDDANQLWIALLLEHHSAHDANVFYLDDFADPEGGFALRTTEALLQRGFSADRLHCANPSEAVVLALKRRGVANAFQGKWSEAPWDCNKAAFAGIYLDLCTGSAGHAAEQLDLACARAAPGCVLAYTLVERNYEGEDLIMRHCRLFDLLSARGWRLACRESLQLSTLLHRSGGCGQKVMTQFWERRI